MVDHMIDHLRLLFPQDMGGRAKIFRSRPADPCHAGTQKSP